MAVPAQPVHGRVIDHCVAGDWERYIHSRGLKP